MACSFFVFDGPTESGVNFYRVEMIAQSNTYTTSKLSIIIDEEIRNLLVGLYHERTFCYRKQGNENCAHRGIRRIHLENVLLHH